MFYFIEIYFRLFYLIFGFFFSFSVFYFLNNYTLSFLLLKKASLFNVNGIETSFVLNSPTELLESNFYISALLAVLFIYPNLIWNFYFFIQPGLIKKEEHFIKKALNSYLLAFFSMNFTVCILIFPMLWYLFEYASLFLLENSNINIEYEPNFLKYLNILFFIIKLFNIGYIIILFFLVFLKTIPLSLFFIYNKLIDSLFFFLYIIINTFFFDFSILFFFFTMLYVLLLFYFKKYLNFIVLFCNIKKLYLYHYYAIKKNR